jgi:hypothetical protein
MTQYLADRWLSIAACVTFALAASGIGHSAEPQSPAAAAKATAAVTVYVDVHLGARTNGAARRLNDKHVEMAAKGYKFSSLVSYTENGDLVGFFVTYTRDN